MWYSLTDFEWADVQFDYPWVLLFLLGIPFLFFFIRKSKGTSASLRLSSLQNIKSQRTWRIRLLPLLPLLRALALSMLIVAMARPQIQNSYSYADSKGYDIMICLDVSWSMMSKDFTPNRLSVAKDITEDFVKNRKGDKIGLIEFSTEALTRVPLTTDRSAVIDELKKAESSLKYSATAIGDAIGLAVDRIKDIPAESKIIVLLTDGKETSGYMTAETALEVAKAFEVKIYTIGIGTNGEALLPIPQPDGSLRDEPQKVEMDEQLLQRLASETEGKYFRASDKKGLVQIYSEINKLEKSEIKIKENSQIRDVFMLFVFISIIFILLEWILRYLILKPKP